MEWMNVVIRSLLIFYYGHFFAFCSVIDIQGCGLRYRTDSHIPTISYGHAARPSDYPWHVAIYSQFNSTSPPEYICGGSIIHHKLVLTAAHCVYDENNFSISNATFTVIAGKYNRSWDYQDSVEQRLKVVNIKIPGGYKGFIQRYGNDIAVLSLNKTIKFSSVVLPICINWNSDTEVKDLSDVTVVGWGLTENKTFSNELLTTQLKYFNFTTCSNRFIHEGFSQYVTNDKFCAGLENGTSVEKGDSGGGLIVLRNSTNNEQRYFIIGIVSTKDHASNIATFTNINKLLPWLNQTVLSFIEEGYCSPLASKSVELTHCKFNGTEVDCNKPAMPGTKAKLQCKNSLHAEFPHLPYTETECQKNLTWSPLMDSCLECGKRYQFNNFEPLITYKERNVSEFPWHVGIYDRSGEEMRYFCGGTIIHPKIILLAAVCAYGYANDTTSDLKTLSVVAGKYQRKWSIKANFEQRFEVSGVIVHRQYILNRTLNDADIAMFVLNDTLKLSSYIMPACIDWSNKLRLLEKPYVSGLIAGWGLTEEGDISNVLRSTQVLMLNHTVCKSRALKYVLTPDKTCIVSEDGSWVSAGDAGGIVLPKYGEDTGKLTYYLQGILSNIVSSDTNSVTDVLYYENWIKQTIIHIVNNFIIIK